MQIQIPSAQIGSVTESDVLRLVANRYPQPDEVQVPLAARIQFDWFGSTTSFLMSVDGNPYQTLQTEGWTFTSVLGPDAASTRIVIQSPEPWLSGQVVTVQAGTIADGVESWKFTAYDFQPPLLDSVVCLDKDRIRVRFQEPVRLGALGPGDALNPQSYYIERVSKPAATPPVSHVEAVSSTEVILTTGFELSFGAVYMLVVTGISDEFDNVFLAPDNVLQFTGWFPAYPAGRRWLLHDFVPRFTIAEDLTFDLRYFLGALQDSNNLLLYYVDAWTSIIDPDTAPEDFVDAMLVDLGNPFDFSLELVQKRKLVKLLVLIYQLKGTAPGIISVVKFFTGIDITIETFTGRGWRIGYDQLSTTGHVAPHPAIIGPSGGSLYSFRIHTDAVLTDEQRRQIRAIAIYMKGAPEHLVGIRDGSVVVPDPIYWTIAVTRVGWARIFGTAAEVPPTSPTSKNITAFNILSDS